MAKKIAVLLSGSGVFDGAEIHESVLTLLALEEAGAEAVIAAPSGPQMHVINHLLGEVSEGESRDILVEAARIARGNITDLASLDLDTIDGVVMPGGFGVAKNFCDFAVQGPACQVDSRIEDFLKMARSKGLPMGFACISPALAAAVFKEGILTLGSDQDPAAEGIRVLGAEHVACERDGIVCDQERKVVSTPAYMADTTLTALRLGLKRMVDQVMHWINETEHEADLSTLEGWSVQGHKLVKEWTFDNDSQSIAWVNQVWQLAQEANHHPDLQLGYSTVKIELTTHDQSALTDKDFQLASMIDQAQQ